MDTSLEEALAVTQVGNSPAYFLVPVFGGAYLVNHLPASLPVDERQRDALLALTPYANGAWGNALRSTIVKTVAAGYSLGGDRDDDVALQARIMFDRGVLSQFIFAHLKDYYCTMQGAWFRVRRSGGDTVSYEHLDTLRVERMGSAVLMYYTDDGGYEELPADDVFNIADSTGCVAAHVYGDILTADKTPAECAFVDGVTVQAVREATRSEPLINYGGRFILPILPETPIAPGKAPTRHAAIGRLNFGLASWKSAFTNVVNASVLQGHVVFSFPSEQKGNRIAGRGDSPVQSPEQPVFNITVNVPPMQPGQTVVNVPAQEYMQPNIVVNVPAQEAPVINVTAAEQPAPVVNIQPAQVNVEAPTVNVAAPVVNNEVVVPDHQRTTRMKVTRNTAGEITGIEAESKPKP